MVAKSRWFVAWFPFHLLLIVAVSVRELLAVILLGLTVLPSEILPRSHSSNSPSSPLESHRFKVTGTQLLLGYLHCTGIEGGYGFFAPNFSTGYRLTFELHHVDGRTDTELPHVRSHAAGLRMTSLLDRIGQEESEKMREVLIRLLVLDEYRLHPDVDYIRAIFQSVSATDPKKLVGVGQSEFRRIYDYRRNEGSSR